MRYLETRHRAPGGPTISRQRRNRSTTRNGNHFVIGFKMSSSLPGVPSARSKNG